MWLNPFIQLWRNPALIILDRPLLSPLPALLAIPPRAISAFLCGLCRFHDLPPLSLDNSAPWADVAPSRWTGRQAHPLNYFPDVNGDQVWLYRPPRPRPSWTLSRFRLGNCHVACLSRPKVVNTWSACRLLMAVGLSFTLRAATTPSITTSPRSLPQISTVGNGIIWNCLFFNLLCGMCI